MIIIDFDLKDFYGRDFFNYKKRPKKKVPTTTPKIKKEIKSIEIVKEKIEKEKKKEEKKSIQLETSEIEKIKEFDWKSLEDEVLFHTIEENGFDNWEMISDTVNWYSYPNQTPRNPIQCKNRYNYLLKKKFTPNKNFLETVKDLKIKNTKNITNIWSKPLKKIYLKRKVFYQFIIRKSN
jgi:hypothetical protein